MKAKFKCWDCKCVFESNPGLTTCSKCGYNYITWLNYDRLFPGSGLPLSDSEPCICYKVDKL